MGLLLFKPTDRLPQLALPQRGAETKKGSGNGTDQNTHPIPSTPFWRGMGFLPTTPSILPASATIRPVPHTHNPCIHSVPPLQVPSLPFLLPFKPEEKEASSWEKMLRGGRGISRLEPKQNIQKFYGFSKGWSYKITKKFA
jgi:hypothetical protein